MFISALLTIAKRWKQSTCSLIDEWINKMWSLHTMQYLLSLKKEGDSDTCYNVDEP